MESSNTSLKSTSTLVNNYFGKNGSYFMNSPNLPNHVNHPIPLRPKITKTQQNCSFSYEVRKNTIESDSDENSFNNMCEANKPTSTSPLLKPTHAGKKQIRTQTSFAKTDVKSEADSILEDNSAITDSHPNKSILVDHALNNNIEAGNVTMLKNETIHDSEPEKELQDKNEVSNDQQSQRIDHATKMVGLLTAEQRKAKLKNYLEKKRKRNSKNKVRYHCRQSLANQRFRFQGRFVKLEDLPTIGERLIVDFDGRKLLKPLFKIEKVHKRQRHTEEAE
jgi:Spy/CpxP family protein refolding chaperone